MCSTCYFGFYLALNTSIMETKWFFCIFGDFSIKGFLKCYPHFEMTPVLENGIVSINSVSVFILIQINNTYSVYSSCKYFWKLIFGISGVT